MPVTICRNFGKRRDCQRVAVPRTGYCEVCLPAAKSEWRAAEDAGRSTAAARGYDAAWAELSRTYRAAVPRCEVPGCGRPAELVDHLLALAVAPGRRLDVRNVWALCRGHHRVKTAIEIKLGLVREGEGGRQGAGVGEGDLPRLTVWVNGQIYFANPMLLQNREWWALAIMAGAENVSGRWAEGK